MTDAGILSHDLHMMIGRLRIPSTLARPAEWLLLAGLLLRAAIPAGYMLDYAALEQGSSPVVMCPSGFPLLDLGDAHHDHDANGGETVDSRGVQCVFAAAAMLAVAFIALGLMLAARDLLWKLPLPAESARRRFPPGLNWRSRAPPALA